MTLTASVMPWNSKVQSGEVCMLDVILPITAAKTVNVNAQRMPVYAFFDAITQQNIDDFFGSVNELPVADFDATAMGADAFGLLIDMGGQVESLHLMEATCHSGTGGATTVHRAIIPAGLTASTLATECELTALGNIGLRIDFGNTPDFDGLTSGIIHIRIAYKTK